jgi:lantibiotic biosynthesis protein
MIKDSNVEPSSTAGPGFAPVGFFMLRASLLPAEAFPHITGTGAGRPGDRERPQRSLARRRVEGRERLWALVADPRVWQALHAASPSLTGRLAQMGDRPLADKAIERVHSTLLRYLTRMSSRATPYGLFAGVALGTFEEASSIGLAADPVLRTRTRSDTEWLAAITERLESDEALRNELPVRPNDLLYRSAGRAILAGGPAAGAQSVSMRITGAMELALCLAGDDITYGELVAELERRFPRVDRDSIRRMVGQLWDQRVLIADLCAPMTSDFPEVHVAERLAGSTECAPVVAGMRRSRQLADAIDDARAMAEPRLLDEFVTNHRRLATEFEGPVHQTDTALATLGTGLSAEIATTAARVGELMMSLHCTRPRLGHIVDYHHAFMERYGAGSEIPLLDALSPEKGLGPPNSYLSPSREVPLPATPESRHGRRDQTLIELATTAAHQGHHEMALSDTDLTAITVWSSDDPTIRPTTSMDVYATIAADSRQAIDEGRWRMVLSPGVFRGLQSFGRFADLFDDEMVGKLRQFARAEEARNPDIVFVELNAASWGSPRAGNLIVRPPVREYEICVNAGPALPPGRQLPLSDILVGADGHGFYLRSAMLGKRLLVITSHAMAGLHAPNVCRALLELSADMIAVPSYFDWGPMSQAPFLPRLVRDRIVLSTARWTLSRKSFDAAEPPSDPDHFFADVQDWRRAWRVPRYVYLTDDDNRLLLDLAHPLCVDELRRELRRELQRSRLHGAVRLHEMLPDFSQLWLSDEQGRRYHSELVIPIVSTAADPVDSSARTRQERPSAAAVTRRWFPGDDWVFIKLYTPVSQQDDVITGPLQRLLAWLREDELIGHWFYVRYADPQPHLRLRFRTTEPQAVMSRCAGWAKTVVDSGWASDFAFTSYDRELERYGGADAIDRLEGVFHANSEVTAGLLQLLREHDLDPENVCVVALHALCQSWGVDPLAWTAAGSYAAIPDATHKRFRAIRPLLCELLVPGQPSADPLAATYAAMLRPLFERQHDVLAEAGELIRKLAGDGRLHGSERAIVESLNHMQVNRLLGADQDSERRCRDLWTLAARAIARRPLDQPAQSPP